MTTITTISGDGYGAAIVKLDDGQYRAILASARLGLRYSRDWDDYSCAESYVYHSIANIRRDLAATADERISLGVL